MPRRFVMMSMLGACVLMGAACGDTRTVQVGATQVILPKDRWASDQDHRLVSAIRSDFAQDPLIATRANLVTIVADNGDVTLSGLVPDVAFKAEAGVRARWLAGLDRVHNAIAVNQQASFTSDHP